MDILISQSVKRKYEDEESEDYTVRNESLYLMLPKRDWTWAERVE